MEDSAKQVFDSNNTLVKNVNGFTDENGKWKHLGNVALYPQFKENPIVVKITLTAEENVVINGLNKAQEISDKIEAKKAEAKADKEAWEAKKEQMKKEYKEKKKELKEEYKAEKKAAKERHKAQKEKAKADIEALKNSWKK